MEIKNNIQLPPIRIIPYQVNDGLFNMATDEFFMKTGDPVLRFYGWKKPTLSFGKGKSRLDSIKLELCQAEGFDFVKRPTGGKTVLHHHELTYSFLVDTPLFPNNIPESYRLISQALINSFAHFGLEGGMKKEKTLDVETSICFKEISSYELTANEKKMVGSAQWRKKERILQHGSILLKIDWPLWKKVWGLSQGSQELEERVTSFYDQLGKVPEITLLEKTIQGEFSKFFHTSFYLQELSSQEIEQILKLCKNFEISNEALSLGKLSS